MQCPKCAHRIPDKADRCLYCGARTKDETSSETRAESRALLVSSGKMGENLFGIQGSKEEINFKKLEELPPSLRAKVEEILKKGEGQSEETEISFPSFPESVGGMGSKRKKMGFLEALRFLLKKE
jgi:hypothetical protein